MATFRERKRADGTIAYQVRWFTNGRQESVTFDTHSARDAFTRRAQKIGFDAALALVLRATTPTATDTSFAAVFERYIASLTHAEPGTRDGYRSEARNSGLMETFGDTPIENITEPDVIAWLSWRQKTISPRTGRPLSAKTIQAYRNLLSQVFNYAIDQKLITVHPSRNVRTAKPASGKKIQVTNDDVLRFAQAFYRQVENASPAKRQRKMQHYIFMTVLSTTALRFSELLALKWGSVIEYPYTHVRVSIAVKRKGEEMPARVGKPKSAASVREVPIPEKTLRLLGPRGKSTDLVFARDYDAREHMTRTSFMRSWEAAARAADMPPGWSPHQLRHWYISTLIARGFPANVVQSIAGHQHITTTFDTYSWVDHDIYRSTAAVMGDITADMPGIENAQKSLR